MHVDDRTLWRRAFDALRRAYCFSRYRHAYAADRYSDGNHGRYYFCVCRQHAAHESWVIVEGDRVRVRPYRDAREGSGS